MKREGYLYLNDSGRYEHAWSEVDEEGNQRCTDYWTSGEGIELRIGGVWVRGRIEHSCKRRAYYFIPAQDQDDALFDLVGLCARRPGSRAA